MEIEHALHCTYRIRYHMVFVVNSYRTKKTKHLFYLFPTFGAPGFDSILNSYLVPSSGASSLEIVS